MSRPLRFIPEHALVEVTTRTLQGRLLLKPSPELTDIILGIIPYRLLWHHKSNRGLPHTNAVMRRQLLPEMESSNAP